MKHTNRSLYEEINGQSKNTANRSLAETRPATEVRQGERPLAAGRQGRARHTPGKPGAIWTPSSQGRGSHWGQRATTAARFPQGLFGRSSFTASAVSLTHTRTARQRVTCGRGLTAPTDRQPCGLCTPHCPPPPGALQGCSWPGGRRPMGEDVGPQEGQHIGPPWDHCEGQR